MYTVSGTSITMTNGDTANINIKIQDYVPADDDKLYFSIKNNINSTDYLLFKSVGKESLLPGYTDTYVVFISSEESNSMGIGTFVYDVELVRPSLGTRDTFIKPSSFIITKGVTENKINVEGIE